MTCTIADCEICAATRRREARPKMTKVQLLADANAADEAYMEASECYSMEQTYRKQLEAHLVTHGCDHDLADLP